MQTPVHKRQRPIVHQGKAVYWARSPPACSPVRVSQTYLTCSRAPRTMLRTPQMSLSDFNLTSSNTKSHPLPLSNATMRLRLDHVNGFPFAHAADAPSNAPIDLPSGAAEAAFANQMHEWLRSITPAYGRDRARMLFILIPSLAVRISSSPSIASLSTRSSSLSLFLCAYSNFSFLTTLRSGLLLP